MHTKPFADFRDAAAAKTLTDAQGTPVGITIVGGAQDAPIVRIEGVADRNEAERWRGKELGVARTALQPLTAKDTYYIADLVGLTVVDPQGSTLGDITQVHNYGAGDILEIRFADGRSELFAFTKRTFPNIDTTARRITFITPEIA